MKKEEILQKNKIDNQNGDEREAQIMLKASNIGLVVGGIVSEVMVIFSVFVEDDPLVAFAALAMYLLMIGSRDLYRYIFTQKKINFFMALLCTIAGLADLIAMIVLGLLQK